MHAGMRTIRFTRRFDFLLLFAIALLVIIGVMMINSATQGMEDGADYVQRQIIYAGTGLVLLIGISLLDYRIFGLVSPIIYLFLLALLMGVTILGETRGGSQGWFNLGIILLQPVELTKILIIVIMARYLSHFQERLRKLRYILLAFLILAPPVALVYLQPDLGGAAVVAFIGLVLIWLAGLRWRYTAIFAILTGVAAPTVWSQLEGYMRDRILVLVGLKVDPGATFTVDQALISVGSGGFLGQGWGHGSQSQLHFLRVRHTDFIFSVIAEELGFVGSIFLLFLFLVVLIRLLWIADNARDEFGRLIACGIASIIFFQAVVSVGMNMAVVPVTGVTLPFISFGGSSLLTLLIGIGLAESVAVRRKRLEF